jgi:hypothetical protein
MNFMLLKKEVIGKKSYYAADDPAQKKRKEVQAEAEHYPQEHQNERCINNPSYFPFCLGLHSLCFSL